MSQLLDNIARITARAAATPEGLSPDELKALQKSVRLNRARLEARSLSDDEIDRLIIDVRG